MNGAKHYGYPIDASLYGECPCGWKYRGGDLAEMENGESFHDPGDSCCTCSGLLCMECVAEVEHDKCIQNCPDCCEVDTDGYTEMDRKRQLSRWWALADEHDVPHDELRGYLAAFRASHPLARPKKRSKKSLSAEKESLEFLDSLIQEYNESTHRIA